MNPTPGRIVNFVLPQPERNAGEVRPAIVVRVWPNDYGDGKPGETVQLQQFTDGGNDVFNAEASSSTVWRTSVHHDEETKAPGTWHWPPRQ